MGKLLLGKNLEVAKVSSLKNNNELENISNKIKDIENLIISLNNEPDAVQQLDFSPVLKSQEINDIQENIKTLYQKISLLETINPQIKSLSSSIKEIVETGGDVLKLVKTVSKDLNQKHADQISINNINKQQLDSSLMGLEDSLLRILNQVNLLILKLEDKKTSNDINNILSIVEKIRDENLERINVINNAVNAEINKINIQQKEMLKMHNDKLNKISIGVVLTIVFSVVSLLL